MAEGQRKGKFNQNGKFGQNGKLCHSYVTRTKGVGAWSMALMLWQRFEYYLLISCLEP